MKTHDELYKMINSDNLLKMNRFAGGHDKQMKGLIKDAEVIAHFNEGDYQGMVATILKVDNDTFIVYSDYYGSCSGCDAWEDATDENIMEMCKNLVYTCKIFPSLNEVITFLNTQDSNFGETCSLGLLNDLKQAEKKDG